jgi:hypothetical protein
MIKSLFFLVVLMVVVGAYFLGSRMPYSIDESGEAPYGDVGIVAIQNGDAVLIVLVNYGAETLDVPKQLLFHDRHDDFDTPYHEALRLVLNGNVIEQPDPKELQGVPDFRLWGATVPLESRMIHGNIYRIKEIFDIHGISGGCHDMRFEYDVVGVGLLDRRLVSNELRVCA